MIKRSVTIEDIDSLYLMWNAHINGSALYRQALREEMNIRGTGPHELRDILNQAREQGHSLEEIVTATSNIDDLEELVEEEASNIETTSQR
ncbi:hypothetical protein [Haloarchaeobius sp. DFWS5]|uniref:hypothetical protein n=1 Tax=Haloarchaeobius sp. DFWS5 TaxID=3446114 RepID=UPI003EC0905F